MLKVFISFHGNKARAEALRLKDSIENGFEPSSADAVWTKPLTGPRPDVFVSAAEGMMDGGVKWDQQLMQHLFSANSIIAIMDPSWIHRIHNPHSVVRRELETGLWNPKIGRVFPYRLGNAPIPQRDDLPPSLAAFQELHFPELDHQDRELGRALLRYERRLVRSNELPFAFITSSTSVRPTRDSLSFFSLVVTELVQAAEREMRMRMSIVVKIPEMDDVRGAQIEQAKLVDRIFRRASHYRALILNPLDSKAIEEDIKRLQLEAPHFPVFTIDWCLGSVPWGTEDQTRNLPPGVMADWLKGGVLAAKMAEKYLRFVRIEKPLVWIITGLAGTEARQDSFQDTLKRSGIECSFKLIPAAFQQDKARDAFLDRWGENDSALPDLVFCTNDEMALGINDALDEVDARKQGEDVTSWIKIIGFDAIHDFTTHIAPSDDASKYHKRFLNTVDVGVRRQAKSLVDLMVRYFQRKEITPRVTMIDPSPFVPLRTQVARLRAEEKDHSESLEKYRERAKNRGQHK